MSRRVPPQIVLAVSLLCPALAAAQPGTAEPATPDVPDPAREEARPAPEVGGFSLLASAGYGASTNEVLDVDLEPYGASFGIEPGYTFEKGFRLGLYVSYGLGRSVTQDYEPLLGDEFELTTDASSLNGGLAIGYDLPLHFLVLRYSLSFGVSWLKRDFQGVPREVVRDYLSEEDSKAGAHLAPGLAVLWPLGLLECGLGFDYFVQINDQFPDGILGKLLVGVKL